MESRVIATARRRPRRTSVDAINTASSSRQINNTPQPQLTNTFATPQKRPYDVIDLTNDDDEKDQESSFVETNKTFVTPALSSFNTSDMAVVDTETTVLVTDIHDNNINTSYRECPLCTFHNYPELIECELCGTSLITESDISNDAQLQQLQMIENDHAFALQLQRELGWGRGDNMDDEDEGDFSESSDEEMLVTVPSDEESEDDSSDEEQENVGLGSNRQQPVAPVRLRNSETTRPPIATGLCEICRETYTRLEYGSNSCPDAFCVECWHTYLSMKLKEHKFPCRCPAPRCRSVVNPDNASRLFRLQPTNPIASTSLENTVNVLGSKSEIESLIQKFKRLHDEAIMQNTCMGFQDIERAKGSANTLEEQQTLSAIRNQKMQKCPNCGFWVAKRNGCNHIACFCGEDFCYRCEAGNIQDNLKNSKKMSTEIVAPAPTVITTNNVEQLETAVIEQKQTTSGLKSFISGGYGGVAAVLVGHPFDLIKVRLQTAPAGAYTGILDVTKQIIAKDGLRGGMGPPLVGVTPVFAVSFWSYDLGKKIVYAVTPNRTSQTLNLGEIMAAGFFSAGPTTLLMGPLERVKVLLQVQGQGGEAKYKGPIDAVKQLYKEGGIRSIFRGSPATFLRDGPGSAAYFGVYELMKRLLTPKDSTPDKLHPGAVLFAGGMAGMLDFRYCFVQLLTLLISDLSNINYVSKSQAPAGTYSSTLDVLRHLLKTDGPGALFKGLGPAMLRAFPANAACFLGVEYSLKAMNYLW
ncbi:7268_t:CDS:10 [Ambispora gerdemannii]|uniref:7268_t:CDS:1 n=1 Tax=Ambispora gerdemannii TaxID=144530 RepID=A0A9N9CND9_9GLOM|nr:7268_t:CDS:10 [Ambispora gerdemannii]